MNPVEAANLGLRFALELCVIGALTYAGFELFLPLGLVFPLAAAMVWGQFVSPRAPRRLQDPARLGVEVVYFGAGVAALALTGLTLLAGVLLAAVVIHFALMLGLKQR